MKERGKCCQHRQGLLLTKMWPAGIKSTVVETQRADHAREIVTGLSLSELQNFDGFVAVRSLADLMSSSSHCPELGIFHPRAAIL